MRKGILETRELTFAYPDGTKALDALSIVIEKGKTTGFLGGNGAGKSTLFLHFNGIHRPTKGSVYFEGKPLVYNKKNLNNLKQRIGIVFQDPEHQLFSASVYEDVSFGVMNLGLEEQEARKRIEVALAQTGILELRHRPTHSLSYGQKKRVALAGVLAMEPEVLILDEPTAGLDPAGISEMMHLIRDIQKKSQLAVVLSTHDIELVPLYCDYVYVMHKGRSVHEGTPDQVFKDVESLRKVQLRTTRIGHLMEILIEKDKLPIQQTANTISEARQVIHQLYHKDV